jgi:DNA-binding IclR family transcriptional regulator
MTPGAVAGETRPDKTTIQSVSRAARILLAVAADGAMTAKSASQRYGLSLPTAYHLLNTLVAEGLLVRDARRGFDLGPQAWTIASATQRRQPLPERFTAGLSELAASTGEAVYLSALRQDEVAVLATIEGVGALRVAGLTGTHAKNLHARASGKLLMAHASPKERARILDGLSFDRLTPSTITSREELEAEFEEIRADGYALDREELYLGVMCVSAPITINGEVVACYTVSTPRERFEQNSAGTIRAVRDAAAAASVRPHT